MAPITWLFPSSTSLLRLHLPLLRGHILLLLLCQHFDLLNDVFRQQLVHSLIPTTSPPSRAAPASTASPPKKAASSPGGPPAACNILHGRTAPAGLRAPAPGMLRLTPEKTQGLREQQDPGKDDADNVA